jgi:hypothetical protein
MTNERMSNDESMTKLEYRIGISRDGTHWTQRMDGSFGIVGSNWLKRGRRRRADPTRFATVERQKPLRRGTSVK